MIFPRQQPPHPMHLYGPIHPMRPYHHTATPTNPLQQIMGYFSKGNVPGYGTSLTTKGIHGLSSTLNNVQQVLRVVQSATPIIQEYGPLIKNLPAMYKMYKAMKDINDEDEEKEINELKSETELDQTDVSDQKPIKKQAPQTDQQKGQSIPKLYI